MALLPYGFTSQPTGFSPGLRSDIPRPKMALPKLSDEPVDPSTADGPWLKTNLGAALNFLGHRAELRAHDIPQLPCDMSETASESTFSMSMSSHQHSSVHPSVWSLVDSIAPSEAASIVSDAWSGGARDPTNDDSSEVSECEHSETTLQRNLSAVSVGDLDLSLEDKLRKLEADESEIITDDADVPQVRFRRLVGDVWPRSAGSGQGDGCCVLVTCSRTLIAEAGAVSSIASAATALALRELLCPLLAQMGAACVGGSSGGQRRTGGSRPDGSISVAFPDVKSALAAALRIPPAITRFNAARSDDLRVGVDGIAIEFGPGVVIDENNGYLYGGAVAAATRLAQRGIVTNKVILGAGAARLAAIAAMPFPLTVDPLTKLPDSRESYALAWTSAAVNTRAPSTEELGVLAVPSWPRDLSPGRSVFEALVLRRCEVVEERDTVDALISSIFGRNMSVVGCALRFNETVRDYGAEHAATVINTAVGHIVRCVRKHNGVVLEDGLWVFWDPSDAVAATLEVKQRLTSHNRRGEARDGIPLAGFGIASSDLLFTVDSAVYYGDALRTAAELARCCNAPGDVHISRSIYETVYAQAGFSWLTYSTEQAKIGGKDIQYYNITL